MAEAKRSARARIRDWNRLKELMDEGDAVVAASEGGAIGPLEAKRGFSIDRARVVGPHGFYKRTQWALTVIGRYKRNLELGAPILQYPTEPIFLRTRAEMNDGNQEDMRRRVANREANRLRALRASRVVAKRPIRRHAKTHNVKRRSRVRA